MAVSVNLGGAFDNQGPITGPQGCTCMIGGAKGHSRKYQVCKVIIFGLF